MNALAKRRAVPPVQGRGRAPSTGSRGLVRAPWLGLGVVALVLAAGQVIHDNLGAAPVLLFLVLPDLAFVAGAGAHAEHGQLPARAVPLYNAAHRTVGPLALIVPGAMGVLSGWWLAAGLAWLAHVAIDRGLGFGLRTPDGWQRV